ncbi:ribokinase [bacterium]|nr:ribokinase [bacterium]
MKDRILVVGPSNTDMIIKLERLPTPGETIIGGEFATAGGGKGANQAVQCARLGAPVILLARIGKDPFGDRSVEQFQMEGIDTSFIIRDAEHHSGIALIFVDKKGENMIAVAPGSNSFLSKADVEMAREAFKISSTLLLQLEIPLEPVEASVFLAKEEGTRVILNPAPAQPLPQSVLENVDILVPNETEAKILSGFPPDEDISPLELAKMLRAKGVKRVIITLGSKGSLYVDENEQFEVPAFKVESVDTTAAGDSFCGALAVAISEGKGIREAIRFASACAAISTTRLGAQPSLPRREEVEEFLRQRS